MMDYVNRPHVTNQLFFPITYPVTYLRCRYFSYFSGERRVTKTDFHFRGHSHRDNKNYPAISLSIWWVKNIPFSFI